MIVVDASVVLEVLLNTPAGTIIAPRLFVEGESLHAPHLIDVEVTQVLRRYALAGTLDPRRGLEALDDLTDFPLTRYPHDLFLSRIWELRNNVTAYDTAYLALAEALAVPFWTRDAKLASAAGQWVRVELV